MKRMNQKIVIAILVIIPILFFSLSIYDHYHGRNTTVSTAEFQGTVLPKAKAIPDFALTTDNGRPFSLKEFYGRWTFVFFGFTRCPDICPASMKELQKVYSKLQQLGIRPLPQVVMISIDPKDTPAQLNAYLKQFNSTFIGALGTQKEVQRLAKAAGIFYKQFEHSGTILLFDTEGKIKDIFSQPHPASVMVNDYRQLVHS